LVKKGARLQIFDPEGEKEGKWRFENIKNNINFCKNEYEAISNADALLILTEWHQFRNMDLSKIKSLMNGIHFFDFRNIYDKEEVEKQGMNYHGVGI
jgi:UDPglucose 6-dehydrogenase